MMPEGEEVTVPDPVFVIVRVFDRVNMALTDLSAVIVTVQVVPDTEVQPVQPAKEEPVAGVAVTATVLLVLTEPVQPVVVHVIPAVVVERVPLPVPVFTAENLFVVVPAGFNSKRVMDRAAKVAVNPLAPTWRSVRRSMAPLSAVLYRYADAVPADVKPARLTVLVNTWAVLLTMTRVRALSLVRSAP